MITPFDKAARSFSALKDNACDWCASPFHKIYRSGLCRHCYDIKAEKRRLYREVKRRMGAGIRWKSLDLTLRINCHVAGKMEEMAKAEGQLIQHKRRPEISAMAIEELLGYISHQLLSRKDPFRNCYYNCATTVGSLFSPVQRVAFIHLLSEAVSQHKRHLRRKRAAAGGSKLVEESQRPPEWLDDFLRRGAVL